MMITSNNYYNDKLVINVADYVNAEKLNKK